MSIKIMSSLHKFHRRTNGVPSGAVSWPTTSIGMGDDTHGFWLGGISSNKLIVAPKSTEVSREWGSYNITRGTVSTSDGLANTNTLYALGSTSHPAAYYAKSLTTGGYNTWYLPAKDELEIMRVNRAAQPFSIANSFSNTASHWSSTEFNETQAYNTNLSLVGNYTVSPWNKNRADYYVRAVRRSTI